MKAFVTGVAGQLGHDVVNELTKRGHQAVGSDIAPTLESLCIVCAAGHHRCGSSGTDNHASTAGCHRALCGMNRCGCSRGRRKSGKSQSHQRRWNETYCGRSEKSRCQNGLYQHRLCV